MNYIKLSLGFSIILAAGINVNSNATPNIKEPGHRLSSVLKNTAAGCTPATATIDIDINNVRARLMTGGDMWWDIGTGTARYEIPKGSGKNSSFAGSAWVGGYDDAGALRVAAQTYRQNGNDYWPGPISVLGSTVSITKETCSDWDRFWKVNKSDVLAFVASVKGGVVPTSSTYDAIIQWPAKGNTHTLNASGNPLTFPSATNSYAPFVDVDGDGKYDATKGDYPEILGDQYIWWVYNDVGNTKGETQTQSIGMEVQASAFAFSTKDYLNDATFYNYHLINRGNQNLNNTYMAIWTDADLGYAFDDYIGCDTTRSLGILYNGKSVDGSGQVNSYGSEVPMFGVDFFIGPRRKRIIGLQTVIDTLPLTVFNYFNNDFSDYGNPQGGTQFYNLMSGKNTRGSKHIANDFAQGSASTGYGSGAPSNFVYYGDPGDKTQWSECSCNRTVGDRRFVHSAGPFTLESGGVTNDITIGAVWVPNVGGCPNTSFAKIRSADDVAQNLFDNHFSAIEGPEAPRLSVKESDRQLIFYLVNDSNSNNFEEKFGYDTASRYHVSTAQTRRYKDSLYKFEGYRVFQLKNSQTTQFLLPDGTVDNTVAVQVFQSDIRNGVSQIVNFTSASDKGNGRYDASIQITGSDSGIKHSFIVTTDAFATGADKRLVNYKTYYFVAVAYAYNNFSNFSYTNPDSTQQTAYLGSAKAAGGLPIPTVAAMPNPANGNMGTTEVDASYGDGVKITRVDGQGNGGSYTEIDAATEDTALTSSSHRDLTPTYVAGMSPVNVRVVNPDSLKALDWKLYITGSIARTDTIGKGISNTSGGWKLVSNNNDVIYSEQNITINNEQILEHYGLSINIIQVDPPGLETTSDNNGYIGSNIFYDDPGKPWLAGVMDGEQQLLTNWIRSGADQTDFPGTAGGADNAPCDFRDNSLDTFQNYEALFATSAVNKGTWTAAAQAANANRKLLGSCGLTIMPTVPSKLSDNTTSTNKGPNLSGVDIVFTSDKSKWTRCAVVETQPNNTLSEHGIDSFRLRSHRSWNLGIDGSGAPTYASDPLDTGMSWFPGYAINVETGDRLNIVFGEDSYQKLQNGSDMIWNPTASATQSGISLNGLDEFNNVVFGGRHYVYVANTRYDQDSAFVKNDIIRTPSGLSAAFSIMQWVGIPLINNGFTLLSLSDGLIPTTTRLQIRVTRPYNYFVNDKTVQPINNGLPLFTFTTKDIAPKLLTDASNEYYNDKQALLDKMRAVPNPYYGFSAYENNSLDTRVRITNLPVRATIDIYSMDGTLVRRIQKDNPNTAYVDWDIRNAQGLQVASGMYLMHVKADGIGEKVIKWFGATRPIDITTF